MWFELWRLKRRLTFGQRVILRYYLDLLKEATEVLGDTRFDDPVATSAGRSIRASKSWGALRCAQGCYEEAQDHRQKCLEQGVSATTLELSERKLVEKYRARHQARTALMQSDVAAAYFSEGL